MQLRAVKQIMRNFIDIVTQRQAKTKKKHLWKIEQTNDGKRHQYNSCMKIPSNCMPLLPKYQYHAKCMIQQLLQHATFVLIVADTTAADVAVAAYNCAARIMTKKAKYFCLFSYFIHFYCIRFYGLSKLMQSSGYISVTAADDALEFN